MRRKGRREEAKAKKYGRLDEKERKEGRKMERECKWELGRR